MGGICRCSGVTGNVMVWRSGVSCLTAAASADVDVEGLCSVNDVCLARGGAGAIPLCERSCCLRSSSARLCLCASSSACSL